MPTIEPGRTIERGRALAVPTHSRTASTPMPSVSSNTASIAASPRSAMTSVAPRSSATFWRSGLRLSAMILDAPRRVGREDTAQADRAVTDDRDRVT